MKSAVSRILLGVHEQVTGRHILARLDELNRTQWLSRDELEALQQDKLRRLLEYAYRNVPYYRRTFEAAGFHPDHLERDPAAFNDIPLLTKEIIRKNFADLQTNEPARRAGLTRLSTSGSTGQPLIFMQDSDYRDAVTADIQRHIGWAGWKLGEPHAFIWGAKPDPSWRQRLRSRWIDLTWNRFQINAFAIDDALLRDFADAIRRKRPRVLFGYVAGLQAFARFVRHTGIKGMRFEGIITSAETLPPPVRAYIEDTFQCSVFDRYGTLDVGGVGCECEAHHGLHLSMENNYVEILHAGRPALPGEIGDVIVTNLNNRGMPFIRYGIGDVARWESSKAQGVRCDCGRASHKLAALEGRLSDAFRTADGHMTWSGFTGVAYNCLAHPSIKQFQVVQKTLERIVVRLALDGELPESVRGEIIHAMRAYFGSAVQVDIDCLDEIPTLPSGKRQYAISEVA